MTRISRRRPLRVSGMSNPRLTSSVQGGTLLIMLGLAVFAAGCQVTAGSDEAPIPEVAIQALQGDGDWCEGEHISDCYTGTSLPVQQGWTIQGLGAISEEVVGGVLRVVASSDAVWYARVEDLGDLADGYELAITARSISAEVPDWVGEGLHSCQDVECPVPSPPELIKYPGFEMLGFGFGAMAQDRYFEIGAYDNGVFYLYDQNGVRPLARLDPTVWRQYRFRVERDQGMEVWVDGQSVGQANWDDLYAMPEGFFPEGHAEIYFGQNHASGEWQSVCFGFCLNEDEAIAPPPSGPYGPRPARDYPLVSRSKQSYSLGSDVIIIPERAFKEALATAAFSAASTEAVTLAREVAGLGRDSAVIGAVANIEHDAAFEGEIFIVTKDARYADTDSAIETDRAYVAAVHLSGTAAWVARDPALLIDRAGRFPTTFCCGDGVPGSGFTWCVPSKLPGGPNDPCINCPPDAFITGGLVQFGDHLDHESIESDLHAEVFDCRHCEVMGCTEPGAESDSHLPWEGECANAFVPEWCHQVHAPGSLPAECGGYCESCYDPYQQICGVYPMPWSPHPTTCTIMPEYCSHYTPEPGSLECDPAASEKVRQAMELLALTSHTGGIACGNAGAAGPGTEQCFWCNSEADCFSCESPSSCPWLVWGTDEDCVPGDPDCPSTQPREREIGYPEPALKYCPSAMPHCRRPEQPQPAPATGAPGEPVPPTPASDERKESEPPRKPITRRRNPDPEPLPATMPAEADFPAIGGDPISLGSGSFTLDHADLSFEGPVRPLEFARSYRSRSTDRSVLGSNWTHIYDARIEVLKPRTAPSWAAPYCSGLAPLATCVLYHDGHGSVRLFIYEKTAGVFLPQAGSTDTIVASGDGWLLRSATGHLRVFDEKGYLINDRDRFGNGYHVEHEPTPLFKLYSHFCPRVGSEDEPSHVDLGSRRMNPWLERIQRQVDRWRSGKWGNQGPIGFCEYLGYVFGDLPIPDFWVREWDPDRMSPPPKDVVCQRQPRPGRRPGLDCRFESVGFDDEIAYFDNLVRLGVMPESVTGGRKQRPVRVTDDLGRALEFDYFDVAGAAHAGEPMALTGLLRSVTGPAGTKVSFEYDRPLDYPRRLNEMFLVGIARADGAPGASGIVRAKERDFSFTYQWHGKAPSTYAQHQDAVYDAYLDYFGSFLGCHLESDGSCLRGPASTQMDGDPCFVSAHQRDRYISSVADNIIRVRFSGRDFDGQVGSCVESETKYSADPFDVDSFDRALEQAWGGTSCEPGSDSAGAFFTTSYPRTHLAYALSSEAPFWVPSEALARYPLDNPPAPPPEVVIPPSQGRWTCIDLHDRTECFEVTLGRAGEPSVTLCTEVAGRMTCRQLWSGPSGSDAPDGTGGDENGSGNGGHEQVVARECTADGLSVNGERPLCDLGMTAKARGERLPGHRFEMPYYELDPDLFSGRVVRTSLSCEELAAAQLSDTFHNDVSGPYVPIGDGTLDPPHVVDRVVGGRDRVQRDLQRICAWSLVLDRDQFPILYGLNFKGQALVEARPHEDDQNWVFHETLYNADGMPIEIRRPTAGGQLWTSEAGYVALAYDEVDPTGNDNWNAWLPAYWTRRMNLVERREVPAGGTVVDSTLTGGRLAERITRYRYEPLFNQPSSVSWLARAPAGPPVVLHEMYYTYDYQLLDRTRLERLLEVLGPFGFDWLNPAEYGDDVADWQLPVPLFDLADGQDLPDRHFFRGLPVEITLWRPGNDDPPESHRFSWAANGRPALIVGPNGNKTRYDYYPLSADYGGPSFGGTGAVSSSGFAGLLASVTKEVVRPWKDDQVRAGIARPPGCAAIAGPYEWLLDSSCGNVASELTALGLPSPVVAAITEATSPATQEAFDERVEYHYAPIGRPHTVIRNGLVETLVHDSDGRLVEHVDAANRRTEVGYSFLGKPVSETTFAGNGNLLHRTVRQHDTEGRLLTECVELGAGGCAAVRPGDGFALPTGLWDIADAPPAKARMDRWRYTNEGRLLGHRDPEGLQTVNYHGPRGLVRRVVTLGRMNGTTEQRIADLTYTLDGDLAERTYSGFDGTTLFETFDYDGLRRPVTRRDPRGSYWQQSYDAFDRLVALKQDMTPYGSGAGNPSWEEVVERDAHGRISKISVNGASETVLQRDGAGRVYRSWTTGEGPVERSHDHLGRVVWEEDAAGTVTVRTFHPGRREMTEARIRFSKEGSPLATSKVVMLDERLLPEAEVSYGHLGEEQHWFFERSAAGFLTRMVRPDGSEVSYPRRNLLGWPLEVDEQRFSSSSGLLERTEYTYNARGQVTSVIDASGNLTTMEYDGFGAPRILRRPGTLMEAWTYDGLGRLSRTMRPSGELIDIEYDSRGDPIRERWLNGPPIGSEDLGGSVRHTNVERRFDELGRLTFTKAFNPLAEVLSPNGGWDVSSWLTYDELGRVASETTKLGPYSPKTMTSTWSVGQEGAWQRDVSYPSGSTFRRGLDAAGRLSRVTRAGTSSSTQLSWWGELYAGRSQAWSSSADPLVESASFDGLGRRREWSYDTVEVGASDHPWSAAWGERYCKGAWDPSCGEPLLSIEAHYDVMGRVSSLSWAHGHPVAGDDGLRDPSHSHPAPWRGYSYDGQGQLSSEWAHSGLSGAVETGGLENHHLTSAEVGALGQQHGAEPWTFEREEGVAGLARIVRETDGESRWQAAPRGIGHRLTAVSVDGESHGIDHDFGGRMVEGPGWQARYGPRDELVRARRSDTGETKVYLFDGLGRLVGVVDTAGVLREQIVHDGAHMVASYSPWGELLWEAVWGAGMNRLLEWRDVAGGSGRHVPLQDHRLSVVAMWSVTEESVAALASYDANGRLTVMDGRSDPTCEEEGNAGVVCSGLAGMPFGWKGMWRSEVTGLVHMRARWYDPVLGEMTSPDPFLYIDSNNPYAYAALDPVNRWDPWGTAHMQFGGAQAPTIGEGNGHRPGPQDFSPVPYGVEQVRARARTPREQRLLYRRGDDRMLDWQGAHRFDPRDPYRLRPPPPPPPHVIAPPPHHNAMWAPPWIERLVQEHVQQIERERAARQQDGEHDILRGFVLPEGVGVDDVFRDEHGHLRMHQTGELVAGQGLEAAGGTATGAARAIELLQPGGQLIGEAGSSSRIRRLRGGQAEAEAFFWRLVRETGATPVGKRGLAGFAELPGGGGTIGFRTASTSGPPTIDVRIPDLGIREIKFVP